MGLYQCNSPDNRRKNFGLIHHVESWTRLICDKNDVCKKRIDALIIPICLSNCDPSSDSQRPSSRNDCSGFYAHNQLIHFGSRVNMFSDTIRI
jgi:hypothetical protein